MWVQEGGDCKDDDTEITSSLFSRFYGTRNKKQTVTTIGIPMKRPSWASSRTDLTKKGDRRDDGERKSSESPKIVSVAKTNPVSPAQFLENIGTNEAKLDQEEDLDCDKRTDLLPMFDIDAFDDNDNDEDELNTNGSTELDLTVVGTRIDLPDRASSPGVDDDLEDFAMDIDAEMTSMNEEEVGEQSTTFATGFDDESEDVENPYKFTGLDITKLSEWEECMDFTTKQAGLLIVEIYSSVFGASNVMYTLISDFLRERGKTHKVKFVRLNLNQFHQIGEIKQVITEYKKYLIASPIPTFVLIRNGTAIRELQGIKPTELEQLIATYSKPVSRPQSAQPLESKKYASILVPRPQSAHSSTYFPTDTNKENQAQASNMENIRNLIRNMNVASTAFTSSSTSTKLSKNSY